MHRCVERGCYGYKATHSVFIVHSIIFFFLALIFQGFLVGEGWLYAVCYGLLVLAVIVLHRITECLYWY